MPTPRRHAFEIDLSDPGSETCHAALEDLAVVLGQLGFTVRKKARKEATLRVYLDGQQYPLLNPRFKRLAVGPSGSDDLPVLVVTVLSMGDEALDTRLRDFESADDIRLITTTPRSGRYECHGHFVIPLSPVPREDAVDLAALEPLISRVRAVCAAPASHSRSDRIAG